MTKRFVLTILLGGLSVATASATDFSLKARAPGPGHIRPTYLWRINQGYWELSVPEKYDLSGGGELRLQKADAPGVAAVCRPTSSTERDLLIKPDPEGQAKYFLTQLPGGITDVKLESQTRNPLPFNGLTNFEVVYSYRLGGIKFRAAFMVSHAVPDPVPGKAPDAAAGDWFTTAVIAPEDTQPELYGALQRLLVTAKVSADQAEPPADSNQFVSHGMMGR